MYTSFREYGSNLTKEDIMELIENKILDIEVAKGNVIESNYTVLEENENDKNI